MRRESSLLADYRVVSGFFSSFFFHVGNQKWVMIILGFLILRSITFANIKSRSLSFSPFEQLLLEINVAVKLNSVGSNYTYLAIMQIFTLIIDMQISVIMHIIRTK